MTPVARILAEEILPAVAKVAKETITGGLVKRGQRYNGALMAIGRAVNGEDFEISPAGLQQPERRMAFIEQLTSATGADGACPLGWVENQWGESNRGNRNPYNPARSAFWRVLRTLARELLDCNEPDWPSHLVWGNIYPLAPSCGGNPNGALQRAQFEGCCKLLHQEIEEYRPRRLIFLTGLDWAEPFLRGKFEPSTIGSLPPVETAGNWVVGSGHRASAVVAPHPQGKPEAQWTAAVVAAFRALDQQAVENEVAGKITGPVIYARSAAASAGP
jgi:hypothetical protein